MVADDRPSTGGQVLAAGDTQQPRRLRRNAVSLPGATTMGIAVIAPAAGMAFVPQIVAGYAGAAVPFAYLLVIIGAVCVAYTISVFARKFTSAGSFYTFNTKGLSPEAGFISGWLLLLGYVMFFPQNTLAFGYTFSSILSEHAGISIPWWAFTIAATALIVGLSVIGLSQSMRVDIIVISFEVLVLLILALVIVIKGGDAGNTAQVFNPTISPKGFSGISFGLIFALGTIEGFEASATAAEECREPKKNIPRALMGAVIGCGIFFVFITYALAIGFGVGHASTFASTGLPLDVLSRRYVGGGFAVVVDVAVTLSALAVSIAAGNGAVRVIFAMARERVLPQPLANLSQRQTPYVAALTVGGIALAVALILGGIAGPYPQAYSYIGALGSLPVAVLYVLVCISLIVYFLRSRDPDFHPVKHLVVPGIGVVVAALPVYGSFHPLPTGAFLIVDIILLAYLVVGVGVVWALRQRPGRLERVGQVLASGELASGE
jgi:amino acid transporter